jgi:hypothetical protein
MSPSFLSISSISLTGAHADLIMVQRGILRVEPARIVPHLEQERSARIIEQQRSESFHANRPAGGFNPKGSEGWQKGAYTQH